MGMSLNMTGFIVRQIEYHDKSFTNDKYLHLYIWGKGTFLLSGKWDSILWEKGHFFLWETGNSILWERFYPLGIGPLILWESDHLITGIRDILW